MISSSGNCTPSMSPRPRSPASPRTWSRPPTTSAARTSGLLAARYRLGLDSLAADAVTPELRSLLTQLTDLRLRLEQGESLTLADPHARAGDLLAA